MSRFLRGCTSGVAVVLLLSHASRAEDPQRRPREFFPNNYANSEDSGGGKRKSLQLPSTADGVARPPSGALLRSPLPGGKEKRIPIVSLLVSSLDKEHLRRVVESAFKLHDQKVAVLVSIQHIGDYRNLTPELEGECEKRGISVVELSDLPPGLDQEVSPIWGVTTPEGRYLLEGIIGIDKFVNEWGILDPKLAVGSKGGGSLEEL